MVPTVDPAEPEKSERCASCGSSGANRLTTEADDVVLCEDCIKRLRIEEEMDYWFPMQEEPAPPMEERFDELFRAARVLPEQGAQEEQIIPTLALAYEIGKGPSRLVAERGQFVEVEDDKAAWEQEADSFVRSYGRLRPVRVVDGTLILEWLPVSVEVEDDPRNKVPKKVTVSVNAHRRLAKAEHVAFLYEKTLADRGIPHDEQHTGDMGFHFYGRGLLITIRSGTVPRLLGGPRGVVLRKDRAPFPHPRYVQNFYTMLLDPPSGEGFRRDLATRMRGVAPTAINLVPACVAFYLREYGREYEKLESRKERKEIHRLLNEHVLRDTGKRLPEEAEGSSKTNQLWRDVGVVEGRRGSRQSRRSSP
jgi:hypothetical protein